MLFVKTIKQKSFVLTQILSKHKNSNWVPALCFLTIVMLLFGVNAFPALYGDEYGSLFDAHHLTGNVHAIGYFSQLYLVNAIFSTDWFLRALSLLWLGAGVYWLNTWLKNEQLTDQMRTLVIWLVLLNPFLWMYGFQIRFYAMFFAASVLFVWRYRLWQRSSSRRNSLLLGASAVLLLSSHLFGALVLGTTLLHYLWMRFAGRRWMIVTISVIAAVLVLLPPVRSALVWMVYRMSNPYADVPAASARGIGVGMIAKIPLTFYFFLLGERVYPLWWWVTVPAIAVAGTAFLLGLWRLGSLPGVGSLSILMMLNIPLMFLVLDPLAPPGLQGAAPRYVIFTLPYFLFVLALGAQAWSPLKPALLLVCLAGLCFLAVPRWSYGGNDFVDWSEYLRTAVINPQQTCVVADGRAYDPVARYLPAGTKLTLTGLVADCYGFSRIVLASNDFRLFNVRDVDEIAEAISKEYTLLSNTTLFPAQITVYEKAPSETIQLIPSRLDLPEQDLRFPVFVPKRDWHIQGFTRLDPETPALTTTLASNEVGRLWILTNFRAESPVEPGTPVFRVDLKSAGNEHVEVLLRAGRETASWTGPCSTCESVYEWTKLVHLLGTSSYSGAHRQYQAHVWGFPLDLSAEDLESVTISYLLPDGTGYFWGIHPE